MSMYWGPTTWLALSIVFLIVEIVTVGNLISIWFSIGAALAFLVHILGGSFGLQVAVFIIVSVALAVLTRPLSKKLIGKRALKTDVNRIIGSTGVVTKTIDNVHGKGTIVINGMDWSARNVDGDQVILENTEVEVIRLDGVKALVRQK
ncbi:MAG: NfeD family protein [Eubacteriaceae bacterium]|nr:NfeD family protein [Eubacteriaceae bacterium]